MSEFDNDYNELRRQGAYHMDQGKKTFWAFFRKALPFFIVLSLVGGTCGLISHFTGDAVKLVKQELSPTVIQKKYEWFKDASAGLDRLRANIDVTKSAIADIIKTYGEDATKWPRDVRQDVSMTRTELRGNILTYNRLQAEYNSQSSKWNWQHFEGKPPLNQNYERMAE